MRHDAADEARLLEQHLKDFPDERDELLLDAAQAWRAAGNHDRAGELLTEAIGLGGELGGNARVALAGVLFELDRVDEARAQLAELREHRPDSPTPCLLAAELMRERGELEEALTWYDYAVAMLPEDEPDDACVALGRCRVRRELGLAPDALDESVAELDRQVDRTARRLTGRT